MLLSDLVKIVARDRSGAFDHGKVSLLGKVFQSDPMGRIYRIEFLRSIDSVYRKLRLLDASIKNSAQIERGYETVINIVFYLVLACVCLAILGLNPISLVLSVLGILVALAFMIGTASSHYFEGILLILYVLSIFLCFKAFLW